MFSHILNGAGRLLDHRILNNTVGDYAICAAAILVGVVLVKCFHLLVLRRVKKRFLATPAAWDDLLVASLESNAIPALYLLVVYLGLRDLAMKPVLSQGLRTLVVAAITVLAVRVLLAVVNRLITRYWQRHAAERTAAREKNLNGIITIARIIIWIVGFILLLDNLGMKVSPFVAGLGITGIAVALAAQAILGDVFSYFVIFFDQPFEVGHSIKVDNFSGEVEHIGLKTTRIRSLDGEQIIFSNKSLTDSRVQNFRRMVRRRVAFTFEIEYGTDLESLRSIPARVKSLVTRHSDATFERAHFKEFGDPGLRFEVVYFLETPDYLRYMDVQQEVNLGLMAEFRSAGIAFAFPNRPVPWRPEDGKAGKSGGPPGTPSDGETGRPG